VSRDARTLQEAADDAMRAGRIFAAYLEQVAAECGVDGPTLSAALAILLASLLVTLDGVRDDRDDARLTVFVDQVRAALLAMRAPGSAPH
jgi:hypothetical protein